MNKLLCFADNAMNLLRAEQLSSKLNMIFIPKISGERRNDFIKNMFVQESKKNQDLQIAVNQASTFLGALEVSERLVMHARLGGPDFVPIFIDWNKVFADKLQSVSSSLLIKACSIAKIERKNIFVLDGTCGFGTDSFMLALAGFSVRGYEQNPIVFEMLKNAKELALRDKNIANIAQRIDLVLGDVKNCNSEKPDVVYLDPIYPLHTRSSAQPKKGMQLLRKLADANSDVELLVETAQKLAKVKVVLKRPNEIKMERDDLWHKRILHTFEGEKHKFNVFKPF